MRELAELYDPDVPFYENEPYVERTKVFMANVEDAMRCSSAIFGTRKERGWVPPSQDDVETVEQENDTGRE